MSKILSEINFIDIEGFVIDDTNIHNTLTFYNGDKEIVDVISPIIKYFSINDISGDILDISELFKGDKRLTYIDLFTILDKYKNIEMLETFKDCINLKHVEYPMSMSNITNAYKSFNNCISLQNATIRSGALECNYREMFSGCKSLSFVILNNIFAEIDEIWTYGMFEGCNFKYIKEGHLDSGLYYSPEKYIFPKECYNTSLFKVEIPYIKNFKDHICKLALEGLNRDGAADCGKTMEREMWSYYEGEIGNSTTNHLQQLVENTDKIKINICNPCSSNGVTKVTECGCPTQLPSVLNLDITKPMVVEYNERMNKFVHVYLGDVNFWKLPRMFNIIPNIIDHLKMLHNENVYVIDSNINATDACNNQFVMETWKRDLDNIISGFEYIYDPSKFNKPMNISVNIALQKFVTFFPYMSW